MRFAVVGAGAIGAYVGAALARGGADVTLIARGPHLRAMQEHGVRVQSPRGDFHVHPAATDDFDAISDADVIFLALKAHSLPDVADRLGAALAPGAAVIAAQNGMPWWYFEPDLRLESVDPGGRIAAAIDVAHVVGCVIYCSTEIVEPGVIRHIEGRRFALGEPDGERSERCVRISEAFRSGGLRAPVETDLRDQIWLKLIGNVAFNAASALTGATLGELGSRPEMVGVLRAVLEECAAGRRSAWRHAPGHGRATARGGLRGGRPQDVDAAGPGGRPEARDRLPQRCGGGARRPLRHPRPDHQGAARVHGPARRTARSSALFRLTPARTIRGAACHR